MIRSHMALQMPHRGWWIAAACMSVLVVTSAPAGAVQDDVGIVISRSSSGPVALGEPVHVHATFDGARLGGRLKSSLTLAPADGSQLPIAVKLVDETLFPDDDLERDWRVDTARFIDRPGTWVLRLSDAKPLTIEVSEPLPRLPRFVDATAALGIEPGTFADANGVTCVSSGAGAAWGDIDGDDDLDLYVTRREGGGVLYRNDDGRMRDVTKDAGLREGRHPETVATFVDIDSDGDQDLHLVQDGGGALWRNDGDGTFTDIARQVGLDLSTAGSAASWADPDRDGDLDVYVTAYGHCEEFEEELLRDAPRRDSLLLQEDDGTFTNHTDLLGMSGAQDGLGFGGLWVDVDDDADVDLVVVNDDQRFIEPRGGNRIWINHIDRGEGLEFREDGKRRGLDERRNAMGIAPIDHDLDGDLDLAVSDMGPGQLLRNDGDGSFEDIARDVGADRGFQDARTPSTSWGLVGVDVDNDADEDIVYPAGALGTTEDYFGKAQPVRAFGRMNLAAPNSISVLWSDKGREYVDIGAAAGLQRYGLWRGLAVADHDDDGRPDLFLTRLEGEPMFMRNVTRSTGHWVALRLRGREVRDACGATVRVGSGDSGRVFQRSCGGVGLGSSHDPRIHVGLGGSTGPQQLMVTWPDGERERFRVAKVDRTVELVQGAGSTSMAAPDTPSDPDAPSDGGDGPAVPQLMVAILAVLIVVGIAIVVFRRRRGPGRGAS